MGRPSTSPHVDPAVLTSLDLWRIAALGLWRLSTLAADRFSACFGELLHCDPVGLGERSYQPELLGPRSAIGQRFPEAAINLARREKLDSLYF